MRPGLFRRLPVHHKLMTMLMITSGAALLLAALASTAYQFFQFRRDTARNLGASAALILANSRSALSFQDRKDATATLAELDANPSVRLACLYESSGSLFASHRDTPDQPCPAAPPPVGYRFSATSLELVQRDVKDGKPTDWLLLRSDLNVLLGQVLTQVAITAIVLLAALMLAFVLSSRLQRLISEPIVDLAEMARAVSQTGDYSRRATKSNDDEVGVLAASFNTMLERITQAEAEREAALGRERDANRAKDQFLATLSHELRTPLSAVLGWTQLLRKGPVSAPELDRALERIERNAHSQSRLIDDLLDMSRILSGKLSLQRQHVDLVAAARAAAESMLALAQARQIELRLTFDDERLLALADTDRINQVINNLLSNALKFTPAGGEVHLTVRRAGEMQELTVGDTGAGITPEFLPRVFEPFRQADDSHARTHGGLGLGLAIVKRIIEMHGGDVAVESEGPGKGAAFRVQLPAVTEPHLRESQTEARGPIDAPDFSAIHVLVVDDDEDARDLVRAALAPTHARVAVAASADEALALALQVPPDVLITDLAMPQIDGYMLKDRLQLALGAQMPPVVVALSAFAAEADRRRSLEQGFNAHVTKPFDPALLLAVIDAQLAGLDLSRS